MSSKVRWIGIVILLLIVILFILPFLIPVNKFRPTIEDQASAALGRKVQLGNLRLSILSGALGIDNLSISDDPKFNSEPFLTAKSVKVGVELIPLIFSQQLNVTEVIIETPQVLMLKDPSGRWNFSSIGGTPSPAQAKPAANAPSAGSSGTSSTESLTIGKLELKDGQITLGSTNSKKRGTYTNVNLTASNVSMKSSFPVLFSMGLPGGGRMKIDGKMGPVDQKDTALTPQNVKLTVSGLNLASAGILDPSLGLGGIADMDANLVSQGGQMATKGELKLSKAVLVAGGSPSGVPATIDFDTKYDLAKGQGVLNPSTVKIGNAKANLNGTYKSQGDEFVVDLKLTGQGLPATDLEAFLPALAVNLPEKSKLTAGTLNSNLRTTGPTDKLITDGTIGLFNGKLSGFDLGSKFSAIGNLAGLKTGNDLVIEKLTANVHMAPTGLTIENLDLVAPALGTVVGGGTLDSKNNMNFNLVATVSNSVVTATAGAATGVAGAAAGGTLGQVLGGGGNCKGGGVKVPFQVRGTTANPQFLPDVGGATASLLKAQLGCAGGGTDSAPGLAGAAGGQGTADVVNQLGGLLGGKKKKP